METTQTADEGLTFEKVWASIQATKSLIEENAKEMKELARKTDEEMKELAREADRRMKETDMRIDNLGRQIGKLGNRFGEMIEYMVMPNLMTKFDELGFTFTKAVRTKIRGKNHDTLAEVDAFLEDGDKVMIVETKAKPEISDIDDHVERMEKLRRYADARSDKRAYLGAIAGMVFGEAEKDYALKTGFYVIEPSGDTFNIIEPKGEYRPREW